jgi:predicted TIM-barrel fold metal-dependent hydrolase
MLAIDCNTFFGVRPDQRTNFGPAVLVEQLAASGVRGALTCSLRGVLYDHRLGNEETLRVCRQHPGLIPAATINLARYVDWEADVDWCVRNGFRAFRLFPDDQHWTVKGLAFARLCERLVPTGLPLFLTITGAEQAHELAVRTADYGLPLVLLLGSYSNEAETIHLTRRYQHVHLDLARRATPRIVRYLVEECGIDRLLFGSNAPQDRIQPALNAVFVADLSAEQTEQILAGNLLRLLRLRASDLPAQSSAPGAVEPEYRGYAGPTIDVHAHLGPWRFPVLTRTTETMLGYARRHNLEKIIISSALGIVYDMRAGNRELKELIDPHPELLGYVVTNPNFVEESAAEMDHYYRFPNFVGAKIHGEYSRTPTSSARMADLFAEIAKRGRPVKIHNYGPDWQPALRELARRHRDLPIIIAHGGDWGTGPFTKDEPNVYFEYGGSSSVRGPIEEALASVGAERILFGTDQDLLDPGYHFGKYYDAGMTPEQAEKVAYTNAKRLFGLA